MLANYAGFCLREPVHLKVVVEQVIIDLLETETLNERFMLRGAIYQTLREQFPCEAY